MELLRYCLIFAVGFFFLCGEVGAQASCVLRWPDTYEKKSDPTSIIRRFQLRSFVTSRNLFCIRIYPSRLLPKLPTDRRNWSLFLLLSSKRQNQYCVPVIFPVSRYRRSVVTALCACHKQAFQNSSLEIFAVSPLPKATREKMITEMEEHCDAIVSDAKKLADDYRAVAKWHRIAAGELK